MALFDIKGKVLEVGETQHFGASGFTKREIIVETKEPTSKYSNPVRFAATKDNCALLDGIRKDDEVTIRFAIDGRTWDGPKGRQYFTDLKIIKIAREGGAAVRNAPLPPSAEPAFPEDTGDDEMPF